jgi:hypothetical protein
VTVTDLDLVGLRQRALRAAARNQPVRINPTEWRALWMEMQAHQNGLGAAIAPAPAVPEPGTTLFGTLVELEGSDPTSRTGWWRCNRDGAEFPDADYEKHQAEAHPLRAAALSAMPLSAIPAPRDASTEGHRG